MAVQPVRGSAVVSTPSSLGATFATMRPRLVAPARSRPSARAIKGAGGSHAGWTSTLLEQMEQRVHARPEIMTQRKELVEHPFGTMKRSWHQGYFLMRGLAKVRAEFSLTVLAVQSEAGVEPRGHAPAAGQPRLRLAGGAGGHDG